MSDAYEKFTRGVHALFLAAGLTAAILACLFFWNLYRASRQLTPAISNFGKAITALNQGVTQLNTSAAAQLTTLDRTNREVLKASADLHDLLIHTDIALNARGSGLLPTLADTIHSQNEEISTLELEAGKNLSDLDAAEREITPGISDFDKASAALAGELPPVLENVKQTTSSTVTIAANTADTSKQLDLTAQDIRAFVHRETTPVRGTWNVIKGFLMEIAGPAAQVATSIK